MSKDLLKEAIADAKAVRSTAIANAKLALEEAFTPRIQSMLSNKIAEEMDDMEETEEDAMEMAMDTDETYKNETDDMDEMGDMEETDEVEETDELEESEEEVEETEDLEEADEVEETDTELEEIIRELEEEEDGEEVNETEEVEETEELEESEEEMEELDLDEVIKALQEEDEVEETEELEETKEDELEEAYNVIRFLKSKINEVNLLNSKLLYSNKLFRTNNLSESQKMKVIETFDRANSVREVKLVYSTLAESISGYTPKKKSMNEGLASKAVASTKPSKDVIVESNDFATRMQRLAGLK